MSTSRTLKPPSNGTSVLRPPRAVACIIPHPDDEIGMAGLILKARAMGREVHMVCLTAGGRVRSGKFRMPAGSRMADVRMEELRASCRALTVGHIHFLGMSDGDSASWQGLGVSDKMRALLREIDPGTVVTYDERGVNGHPDHVMAHAVTREAFLGLRRHEERELVFLTGYPKSYAQRRLQWIPLPAGVTRQLIRKYATDDAYVSFILRLTARELKTKLSLVGCHASQFPEENGRYFGVPFILLRLFFRDECYSGKVEWARQGKWT